MPEIGGGGCLCPLNSAISVAFHFLPRVPPNFSAPQGVNGHLIRPIRGAFLRSPHWVVLTTMASKATAWLSLVHNSAAQRTRKHKADFLGSSPKEKGQEVDSLWLPLSFILVVEMRKVGDILPLYLVHVE